MSLTKDADLDRFAVGSAIDAFLSRGRNDFLLGHIRRGREFCDDFDYSNVTIHLHLPSLFPLFSHCHPFFRSIICTARNEKEWVTFTIRIRKFYRVNMCLIERERMSGLVGQ